MTYDRHKPNKDLLGSYFFQSPPETLTTKGKLNNNNNLKSNNCNSSNTDSCIKILIMTIMILIISIIIIIIEIICKIINVTMYENENETITCK